MQQVLPLQRQVVTGRNHAAGSGRTVPGRKLAFAHEGGHALLRGCRAASVPCCKTGFGSPACTRPLSRRSSPVSCQSDDNSSAAAPGVQDASSSSIGSSSSSNGNGRRMVGLVSLFALQSGRPSDQRAPVEFEPLASAPQTLVINLLQGQAHGRGRAVNAWTLRAVPEPGLHVVLPQAPSCRTVGRFWFQSQGVL